MSTDVPSFSKLPQHVAIIMDGNGRWARQQNMPRLFGHQKGVDTLKKAVETAIQVGIPYLTVWAFSTENWRRPEDEVKGLLNLFKIALKKDLPEFHKQNIRLKVLGLRNGLDKDLVDLIDKAEDLTKNNTALVLTVAFNYGGRADILQATQKAATLVLEGKLQPQDISEDLMTSLMLASDIPDPDLIIRTGKVSRISNFMLWQGFYAELVFQDILWPEFSPAKFYEALHTFESYQRNFGRVTQDVATA